MSSTLTLTVALPPTATGGTWTLTPDGPYAVAGSSGVVAPFRGDIDNTGKLIAKGGGTALIEVPASGGYDAGQGVLTCTFVTPSAILPGQPIRIPLVETSTGVMDVAYLLNVGAPQILTPQQATSVQALITGTTAATTAANLAAANARAAVTNLPTTAASLVAPAITSATTAATTATTAATGAATAATGANAAANRAGAAAGNADTATVNANTATQAALSAAAGAAAAAGITAWNGGDHTTLPNTAGFYRIMTGTEIGQVWQAFSSGGPVRRQPLENAFASGQGALLLQTSGVIDGTSRSLPTVPAGAGFAQLTISGTGMTGRYDSNPATGGPAEERYLPGGVLRLTSATEIAAFRYLATAGTGTYSIVYRTG